MPQTRSFTPEVQDFIAKGLNLIQAATEMSGQPVDADTMHMLSAVRTLCGSLTTALDLLRTQNPGGLAPPSAQSVAAAANVASAAQSRSKS